MPYRDCFYEELEKFLKKTKHSIKICYGKMNFFLKTSLKSKIQNHSRVYRLKMQTSVGNFSRGTTFGYAFLQSVIKSADGRLKLEDSLNTAYLPLIVHLFRFSATVCFFNLLRKILKLC